jgi:uncharacterized membrane protein
MKNKKLWIAIGLLPTLLGWSVVYLLFNADKFRGCFLWRHATFFNVLAVFVGFVVCQLAGRKLAEKSTDKVQLWDPTIGKRRLTGFLLGLGFLAIDLTLVCGGCTAVFLRTMSKSFP